MEVCGAATQRHVTFTNTRFRMNSSSSQTSSDATSERLVALLTGLVKALVDEPEAVAVHADATTNSTALRLQVAPNDLGKGIGKQGRTARSLRTILTAIGSKTQHRISLDVVEADGDGGGTDGRHENIAE